MQFGVGEIFAPLVRTASSEEDWSYRKTWEFLYELARSFNNIVVLSGLADVPIRVPAAQSADLLLSDGPLSAEMVAINTTIRLL